MANIISFIDLISFYKLNLFLNKPKHHINSSIMFEHALLRLRTFCFNKSILLSVHFSSVANSCLTLCDPMNRSTPALTVHHQLPEFTQTHVHWVGDATQPSHPLLSLFFLPSIFPNIRVFSNELALHIRWPKYCNFSFSISPSNPVFRVDFL